MSRLLGDSDTNHDYIFVFVFVFVFELGREWMVCWVMRARNRNTYSFRAHPYITPFIHSISSSLVTDHWSDPFSKFHKVSIFLASIVSSKRPGSQPQTVQMKTRGGQSHFLKCPMQQSNKQCRISQKEYMPWTRSIFGMYTNRQSCSNIYTGWFF